MRYTWLDEKKSEIIEKYSTDGASLPDLGTEYGVAPNTIRNRLQEWGVEIDTVGQRYEWLDDHVGEIVEQYVTYEESLQAIADEFGTSAAPIKKRLLEAGVELRPVDYSFTEEQVSVIEGELLGDGCIYRRHDTACHFRLESTVKAHPAYVCDLLPNGVFPNTQPYSLQRSTKWGDNARWIIYSRGQQLFDALHSEWYEQNGDSLRKVVPEEFELTETALFHWYIGDGSLSRRENGSYRMHFSTHGFPETSVRQLQTQLDSMGYDNYTSLASHVENGSGLAIYIATASSEKLLNRLASLNTVDEYEYKFAGEGRV